MSRWFRLRLTVSALTATALLAVAGHLATAEPERDAAVAAASTASTAQSGSEDNRASKEFQQAVPDRARTSRAS